MTDYKAMYFKLAAKMTDAIDALETTSRDLKTAQLEAEEMYISAETEKNQK